MSASVLEYVDVQISREVATVSSVGFGALLLVGVTEGAQVDAVASYGSADEVADVFAITDPEYLAAQAYFGQTVKPQRLYITVKAAVDSFVDALTDAVAVNDDWYAVAIISRLAADIEAVAAWTQARYKLFLAATADATAKNAAETTDVASDLLAASYDRTGLLYHAEADAAAVFPDVAWAGRMLPLDPGSATWAWKTLSGIAVDTLTATERDALEAKRASYYTTIAGNNVTFEGQTSSPGGYLDITRGLDWLTFRIAEDIVAKLASTDKIPYIGGGAIIESVLRERLDVAVERGIIAEDYSVTVPPASEQTATDRANRLYNDVTFEATLAGAVHRVRVRGTVTV